MYLTSSGFTPIIKVSLFHARYSREIDNCLKQRQAQIIFVHLKCFTLARKFTRKLYFKLYCQIVFNITVQGNRPDSKTLLSFCLYFHRESPPSPRLIVTLAIAKRLHVHPSETVLNGPTFGLSPLKLESYNVKVASIVSLRYSCIRESVDSNVGIARTRNI